MKMITGLVLTLALALPPAQAATVAVVDSGTYFDHADLKGHEWMNPGEVAGNRVDDDQNKKVDDISGWNFAENYGRFFFPQHISEINPIVYPLFEVLARMQANQATEADKIFWEENVKNLPVDQKQALIAHLNYYGEYAHGTHCSGIVASQAPDAKILAARVFPDSLAPEYSTSMMLLAGRLGMRDYLYKFLALLSNGIFAQVSPYLAENKVDVANYSLGVPLKMIAEQLLKAKKKKTDADPTTDQIAAETQRMYAQFKPQGEKWMKAAPNTLFVIAAGNDGSDNELFPTFPAGIRLDNSITVAASDGYKSIATFSNWGIKSVDVAAPGVAIMSSVPAADLTKRLPLSGTSMAAPFVTGVAAKVKGINPKLAPSQIRAIVIGTVDKKAWLSDKVISGGVVNADRALSAAELTLTRDVESAIAMSRTAIADQAEADPSSVADETAASVAMPTEMREWASQLVF